MFTSVRSIYGTAFPREAEEADARLALYRRHDKHSKGKNRQGRSTDGDFFAEDRARVSTAALLAFLEDLLQSRFGFLDTGLSDRLTSSSENSFSGVGGRSLPGRAAKVAQAYEHAAETVRLREETNLLAENEALNNAHADREVQLIQSLIQDLRMLTRSGVDTLDISRGNTFLDSLLSAVEDIKKKV